MRTITASPHFHSGESTKNIMFEVFLSLLPASFWGVYVFGLRALLVLLVSLSSSVLFELVFKKISKDNTVDCSCLVTGILIGMNMSPTIPLFIPVVASFFAIVITKWTFGGLGSNWANPAIAGRLFVFFSFTGAMSSFVMPRTLSADIVSGATPLSLVKTALSSGNFNGLTGLQILEKSLYPVSGFASNLSQATGFNPYNIDAFFGNIGGCIGEVSSLLLLLGGIYLICRKIITWHTPVVYIGSFALMTWIFGGIPSGLGLFKGEAIASILRGGLFLGAFFMATDYVTTPVTHKGQVIFGFGCALFTFILRTFGSLAEAVSVAILIMNIATPTIDKFCKPRLFGSVKGGKK